MALQFLLVLDFGLSFEERELIGVELVLVREIHGFGWFLDHDSDSSDWLTVLEGLVSWSESEYDVIRICDVAVRSINSSLSSTFGVIYVSLKPCDTPRHPNKLVNPVY